MNNHFLRKKKILLVSHDLTFTGSPLVLVECGVLLKSSGADVSFCSLDGQRDRDHPACRAGFGWVTPRKARTNVLDFDLLVANTLAGGTKSWVADVLLEYPKVASKIIWWVHEIDCELYGSQMKNFSKVAAAIFDSHASLRAWKKWGVTLPSLSSVVHLGVAQEFLE